MLRESVADLITSIIDAPELHVQASLVMNKPNTDGDKPHLLHASAAQRKPVANWQGRADGLKSHLRLDGWQNKGFLKSIHNFA